ncbi:heat shock protein 9/12-like protein [Elsinoe australis]|uniref:Heat shock protein 9/12-like protein n=1 Tax=Elsinoe australis TaxID=40998 RepID=A0A2P8A0B2_9PEZI|nr:hypothetical protein B9Z65_7710 [Elsinoe australis]TKX24494.1 heat shock protein 9/12-like protein [Elsinoe australis]
MSEAGRKDFSDKLQEKATPQSSKSTTDKVSEGVTDTADKAARAVQPDSQKSGTQETADKLGRSKDEHTDSKPIGDKIKDAVGLGGK